MKEKSDGKLFMVSLKNGSGAPRLIKARGPGGARDFVSEGLLVVRPVGAEEAYKLSMQGVKLEGRHHGEAGTGTSARLSASPSSVMLEGARSIWGRSGAF